MTAVAARLRSLGSALPWAALALGLALSAAAWWALGESRRQAEVRVAEAELQALAGLVGAALDERVDALRRMARRIEERPDPTERALAVEAAVLRESYPSIRAIAWVGPDLVVARVFPSAGNEVVVGYRVAADPVRAEAFAAAAETGEAVVTRPVELLQGGRGLLIVVPVGGPAGRDGGFVYAAIDPEALFERDLRFALEPGRLEVTSGGGPVYAAGIAADGASAADEVQVAGTVLEVEWTTAALRDPLPAVVGVSGAALSALLAAALLSGRRSARAALALARSEAAQRAIVDTAVDAVVVIDGAGTVRSFNPAAERLFGRTAAGMLGRNVSELMPHGHARAHDGYLERYARTGERRIIGIGRELEGRRADGATFPIDLAVGEWTAGDERFFTAIVRDISDRRRAEEDLRRRTAELEDLARTLDLAPVLIRGQDGRIRHWTEGTARLYGFGADEAVGRIAHELLRTRFPYPLETIERDFAAGGSWRGELRHRRKDGAEIVVESVWTLRDVRDGGPPSVIEVNADVTERRAAERAAAEGARLLRAVVDGALDPIFVKDAEGRYVLANRRVAETLGAPPDELLGRTDAEFVPPTVAASLAGDDARVIETGRPVLAEVAIPEPGGARVFLTSKSPLRDEAGRVAGVIGVARDITERKRAEEEVRALARSLERRVEERTRELAEANEELRDFASTVAHDLRAPLRAMDGFARALEEDHAAALDEEARGYIARIVAAAARMDGLIRDLLEYARIGREELASGPVALGPAVDEALRQLEAPIRAAGARIVAEPDMPAVVAQRAMLVQAIANLVANAVKFVPQDRVPEVRIRAVRGGGRVRLEVEDNGIGVAPEHRERIFRVFQRLHGMAEYPGTGIGLAIVRRAAERMGGSAGVAEAPGGGSVFRIELEEADDARRP
jgi:PAS domain S-box-containing protein